MVKESWLPIQTRHRRRGKHEPNRGEIEGEIPRGIAQDLIRRKKRRNVEEEKEEEEELGKDALRLK